MKKDMKRKGRAEALKLRHTALRFFCGLSKSKFYASVSPDSNKYWHPSSKSTPPWTEASTAPKLQGAYGHDISQHTTTLPTTLPPPALPHHHHHHRGKMKHRSRATPLRSEPLSLAAGKNNRETSKDRALSFQPKRPKQCCTSPTPGVPKAYPNEEQP